MTKSVVFAIFAALEFDFEPVFEFLFSFSVSFFDSDKK
jgi:hypothetical protein